MEVQYEIVHVKNGKEPETIGIYRSEEEVKALTETARYAGTWMNDKRKLLRYGRGELRIHTRNLMPKVISHNTVVFQKYRAYDLFVINHPEIVCIRINTHFITGYGVNDVQLWETQSFRELANIVDKELAYVCQRYYDQFIEEFSLAGAI